MNEIPSAFRSADHIHVFAKMEPYPDSSYQPLSDHDKVARAYYARIVVAKVLLLVTGCASFAVLFSVGTPGAILGSGALALGVACFGALFARDFLVWLHCPKCGKKMKFARFEIPRLKAAHRYLVCPDCRRFVDIGRENTLS
jgi:hypothetical protein